MTIFYCVATATMKALLIALTRWQVRGKENVPRHGPLIVVSNHLSLVDPPLLSASFPRGITFMAKQELFRPSLGAIFVRAYGAFSVRRGGLDREALRQALKVIQKGGVLGMFPEGKRSPTHRLQPIQPGSALLAARTGAPIIPVGISGSEQVKGISVILSRPSITVTIGRPFILPPIENRSNRSKLVQHSDLIAEHMNELLPQSYRVDQSISNDSRGKNGD